MPEDIEDIYLKDIMSRKQDWCPLKPIPEKANHPDLCDGGRYDKGYNACIDELLKGEEG